MKVLQSLLICLYLAYGVGAGQTTENTIKFENLSIQDGLSQSSANCIYQDTRGFLWIGTEDGLNKYDGYSFRVYKPDPNKTNSISHSRITTVQEDPAGNLWIGTNGGGLNKYDRNADTFHHFLRESNNTITLNGNNIGCLFQYDEDELWIGTDQGINILRYAEESFIDIAKENPDLLALENLSILSITGDHEGNVWIGTSSGLYCYLAEKTLRFIEITDNSTGQSGMIIHELLADTRDGLWIGTEKGLIQSSPSNASAGVITAGEILTDMGSVRALHEDGNGNIWIGTFGNGLYIYHPGNGQYVQHTYSYSNPNSISNNEILSVYSDHSGIVWIGSNGLDKYNPHKEKFTRYDYVPYTSENLIFRNIHPIYEDNDQVLWIGSKGDGIHILDRNAGRYSRILSEPGNMNSLPSNRVRAILENPSHTLWIGTDDAGLCKIILDENRKPIQYTSYRYEKQNDIYLSGNTIYDLHVDENGRLWIGTDNGLTIMDPQTEEFSRYRPDVNDPRSISHTTAYSIYADNEGNIWVATDNGLNLYDPVVDGFTHFIHDNEDTTTIIYNELLSFHEDEAGYLWIGTYGYGIDRLDKNTGVFKHFTHVEELSTAVVYGILEDDDHMLWLSTNNGIIRFNPESETAKIFSVEDGLQSNEYNGNSYFESKSGEMFFGGQYGFNGFFPEEVIIDSITPVIVLTDLMVNNLSVNPGDDMPLENHINEAKEINLTHKQNNFTLYFSALHYANPDHNQYRYRLEGFDEQWIDAGTKQFATYTNLPYKNYTFQVIASNSDGIWNTTGTNLTVRVRPPFWATLWFRVLAGIMLVAAAYYLYRKRMQRGENQKHLLEEKFIQSNSELQKVKDQVENQRREITLQKQELKLRERDQRELLWFNQGIAKFTDIISREKHDVATLCRKVIIDLVEYLDAQLGGIYLLRDDDKEVTLELVAHNGYETSRISEMIHPGEGYTGTCFNEARFMEIDNLPAGYAILHSGLGSDSLKHVLLAPLTAGDECIGVIELYSFKKLKGFKVTFVEKLIESLASSIHTEQANKKLKHTMEDSAKQAKELQERENELRMQLEENMAIQEEFERREKELTAKLEEFTANGNGHTDHSK